NNKTLYLMNFTADVVISNKSGQILAGFQNLPISQIVSHYKNKELNLVVSLSQSNPFPPGDYILKYIIHDKPSGNSFDIKKNIKKPISCSLHASSELKGMYITNQWPRPCNE